MGAYPRNPYMPPMEQEMAMDEARVLFESDFHFTFKGANTQVLADQLIRSLDTLKEAQEILLKIRQGVEAGKLTAEDCSKLAKDHFDKVDWNIVG